VKVTELAAVQLPAGFILSEAPAIADKVRVHKEIGGPYEQIGREEEAEHKVYDQNNLILPRIANNLDRFLYLGLDLL
jgi:hypothetical protein